MKRTCCLPILLILSLWGSSSGCGRRPPPLRPGEVAYEVTGLIRDFPVDARSVVIRHEEIPGYMPRMTMTFTLRDPRELRGLQVGDTVGFRLVAAKDDHWIDSLRLLGRGAVAPPMPVGAAESGRFSAPLVPGDPLPDFAFTDEHGQELRLSDFRGRTVAFTFLFTRCPLPDYCPRMSRHFANARDLLLRKVGGRTNWQFLSLSFDPEFDRPERLRAYARGYRGDSDDRWRFGVLSSNVLGTLAPSVDLQVVPEGGTFLHNLRTVVVDPQGRIAHQFDRNEWTPEELAAEITRTLASNEP